MQRKLLQLLLITLVVIGAISSSACGDEDGAWNNPYPPKSESANIRFSSFYELPKTLDPARSYSSEENIFTGQIYEPPLQYHYLQRPYTLVPLTAAQMPTVTYLNAKKQKIDANATSPQEIAYSVYDIFIRPGIFYQPHPAFAKKANGEYDYHHLSANDLRYIDQLSDFKQTGTRELIAEDYVYQIKRLASPKLNSPILGFMQTYILGLTDYANNLQKVYQTLLNQHKNHNDFFLDLRQFPLEGTQVIDRYHYQIWLKGKYPQFMFWLAMPFFAPVPWEADYFYSQPGMYKKDIAWDWNPVGTGPYMLTENNPNRRMVLARNPNFHGEKYPTEGLAKDYSAGLMVKAGQPMPFIDKVIYSLEKESIPRWNKFLQGYYDLSNIASDSFDQAIHLDENGNASLTPTLKAKNIILQTIVEPAIYYYGFNMLDPIVGGYSNTQKKLRQAIAIALDRQEYIAIFLNGRGSIAQGPIPPGIFGYVSGKEGVNPYLYDWENNRLQTKSINYAKKLLAQAGYPNGIDPKTKQALVLNYDVVTSGGPDDQATLNWMRKQFAKLGIQLNIRATLYNRFQEKVRTGNAQFFSWAWSADYPDPENFLFLLYGPNGKVRYGGENATNYVNPAYDALFEKMRGMENGSERQAIIQKMIAIVQADSPWVWGYYPKTFLLQQEWMGPIKLSGIANNELKYQWLDYKKRAEKIKQWNRPIAWPLLLIILIIIFLLTPVFINYWRREHRSLVKRF